jgi:hypothetical protein
MFSVLAIVAASCSTSSDTEAVSDAELQWCAQVDDSTVFDAIWDAADELGVDSVGTFLLKKADISTDVDPRELTPEDLTDEELAALSTVGDDFDNSDVLWIEYINSSDGSKACLAAYATVNG